MDNNIKIIHTDKNDKKISNLNNLVKSSFSITYVLLLTTATITFIESMRTPNAKIRSVLNLETCISIVAGYFYSIFIKKIKNIQEKYENKIIII